MPRFIKNKPVTQVQPIVKVELGPNDQLPLGASRFELVVTDDAGNESEPASIEVVVLDAAKPTAVLDVVDGNGKRVEPRIRQGQGFNLSGARSSDKGDGKVVKYRFTLVDRD
ncbi:hypothetical protein [Parerythrobacter jejuensis]|uniref:Uncharacterized protein n=1 Tax=Parerythrobacter jejuensis TaxID=795812 RepID=A0A845AZ39_9SPHN|nr:hypothetical protein [Parerythrobacter jejuensis]MXP31261.1 hypothetical protein [Parerythrobacter jejuensis]MXP34021.1 hypothetical protein [Parerythrobacter jejuensis]